MWFACSQGPLVAFKRSRELTLCDIMGEPGVTAKCNKQGKAQVSPLEQSRSSTEGLKWQYLGHFSVTMIKQPAEVTGERVGQGSLRFKSVTMGKPQRWLVTVHPRSGSRKHRTRMLNSASPFDAIQDPSTGKGCTRDGQTIPYQLDNELNQIISHKLVHMPSSSSMWPQSSTI